MPAALERIRQLRNADRHHHYTLVCADLAEIGRYARIDTWQFRLLKAATPGPFTFLLPATRETPRRLQHSTAAHDWHPHTGSSGAAPAAR